MPWAFREPAQGPDQGYVVHTLEAALWALGTTSTFEDALSLAVNHGEDTDTVGAVTGQLAGALYGAAAVPARWLAPLAWRTRIIAHADRLPSREAPWRRADCGISDRSRLHNKNLIRYQRSYRIPAAGNHRYRSVFLDVVIGSNSPP
ncbi:ADP-ribosylglycohydrolase family protein [Methylorubrum extorquens]|uniref:ADP-ribosylglycohydrolase family protein n=1 Tax=Methylorubrum extorquens TaxID=408 RepID=UPI0024BBD14E|nr:ADP-ribosylglycohydrolase family protein [Methylorubrum extorquens]